MIQMGEKGVHGDVARYSAAGYHTRNSRCGGRSLELSHHYTALFRPRRRKLPTQGCKKKAPLEELQLLIEKEH